jgi:very-short-patch-repair endonuclease
MEKCHYCDYQTDNKRKFAKHGLFEHNLNKQNYLIQVKYDGIQPTCKCGCGELMKYNATLADFPSYNKNHLKEIHKGKTFEEIWGDPKSEKRVKAISEARKSRFASGEFDYIRDAVRENRKQIGLGEKISKGAKGVPKPKPEGFGVGRIHSDETKKKMEETAIKNLLKYGKVKRSKLEYFFEDTLKSLNVNYQHSYLIPQIKKIFDFYLPEHNILIEVDGDFWHCHPDKFPLPTHKSQEINLINDQFKNKWAQENGYKLLRFWETDINNNPEQVKQILLENIK